MGPKAGWSIWGKSGTRIRQFMVAFASRNEALVALKADNPDVEVISHDKVAGGTLEALGMTIGDIMEWVPLDCKEKLAPIGRQRRQPRSRTGIRTLPRAIGIFSHCAPAAALQ